MKTYFVTSDIHSFYTPFKQALDEAGFDINNPDHILICCGDIFDRGDESLLVYDFIKSLPKSRRILIKGNHEELFLSLALEDRFPYARDFSNGTVKTFTHIADTDYQTMSLLYYGFDGSMVTTEWLLTQKRVKNSKITKWLQSDEWIDYYELGKYIFVHSFIPLNKIPKMSGTVQEYNPDWRNASTKLWDDARWGCPWQLFDDGYFKSEIDKGKVLVCGHWHTSDFHKHYENKRENYDIYRGKNLIALDACTIKTNKVNILVLTEEEVNS